MKLLRRIGGRMSVALLVLGNIAAVIALSGTVDIVEENLECTNDLNELMTCDYKAQNCAGYNLTLERPNYYKEDKVVYCIFEQCSSERCCCSTNMMLIYGETHTATVWRGAESLGAKHVSIKDGIKPKVPTLMPVKESNGNFQVMWKTNMDYQLSLDTALTANVTYRVKGETEKHTEDVTPTAINGLKYHEILGRHLKPSTTYVVSVQSYTDWSGRCSDSSEEREFTTPAPAYILPMAIIISLSVAAVIISAATYVCYVKFKAKWWDPISKYPNPRLFDVHPCKPQICKPVKTDISPICVEPLISDDTKSWSKGSPKGSISGSPQQSSGISTGSSLLSYANTEPADIVAGVQEALDKAFADIVLMSPINAFAEKNVDGGLLSTPYNSCDVRADEVNSGSSDFFNRTYSILLPNFKQQVLMDSSEVQMQPEMSCDSSYQPSQRDIVILTDEQACPLVTLSPGVSSFMPMDMSYQQCNADSGRFSYAEDSSLSSVSSSTNTVASGELVSRVEATCERCDEAVDEATEMTRKQEEGIISDENPCYGCVPTGPHSFPPVDNDYQAFQTLVGQPDTLFSDKRSGEEDEHLDKYQEESFTKMPQSFFSPVVPDFVNNVQGVQGLSELQRPFLPMISADQSVPIITDGGYQSV